MGPSKTVAAVLLIGMIGVANVVGSDETRAPVVFSGAAVGVAGVWSCWHADYPTL